MAVATAFLPEVVAALASNPLGRALLVTLGIHFDLQAASDGMPVGGGAVRVGRWMSEAELAAMQKTGRVVESQLNGVTSVTSPPNAQAWMRQTDGTHFVEFNVAKDALRATDGVTGKIFGPNSIFGPKLGIKEMPVATNIVVTGTKQP